jgi:hypothetical protein
MSGGTTIPFPTPNTDRVSGHGTVLAQTNPYEDKDRDQGMNDVRTDYYEWHC